MERLRSIDWEDDDEVFDHAMSRAALLREYLRRMAHWARAFNAEAYWPFFDLAPLVDPTVRPSDGVIAELDEYLSEHVGWPSIARTCRGAVNWAALRAQTTVGLPDLEDPYEPLLLLYQRGGGFTVESHFIDLTGVAVPIKPLEEHLMPDPIVELDPKVLDELDAGST
ncbi:hypothetical protein AB0K09_15865 [Streptomyces sp. NPDC049577]|uniref:hypothetical protein n=1 Tax=Streptomyces sp. NPDC049577 TaxID=3155153 RepID=UPI00342B6C68